MRSRASAIEIVGVWLPNKGAELMAWAVKTELGSRLGAARMAREPQGPESDLARLGFVTRRIQPKKPSLADRVLGLRERIRPSPDGSISARDVTHYVDISGFAYGDFWGVKKAKMRAGQLIETGKPVYLLPQAFGPFNEDGFPAVMDKIARGAAMICARDRQSFGFLCEVAPTANIRLLPDITFSLDLAARPVERPAHEYGCLIVNSMLQRSETASETETIAIFAKTGAVLRAHGIEPVVVVHEPSRDLALSQGLAQNLEADLVVLDDARDLKAFIARATIVVTGRFHGLANGLSSGVPSFAVGWSHKYQEMLEDFAMPEAWYDQDDEAFTAQIHDFLSNISIMTSTKARLEEIAQSKRAELMPFWDELADHIQNNARP